MIHPNQNGFALIEVLVSMLVLAIGVLGTIGLHLAALRTAQQSAFHDAASQLASEIAEKMRVYSVRLGSSESNPFIGLDYSAVANPGSAPAPHCHAVHCSPAELAQADIHQWKVRLRSIVPDGRLQICRDATPWDREASSFRWHCAETADSSAPLLLKVGWSRSNATGNHPVLPLVVVVTGSYPL